MICMWSSWCHYHPIISCIIKIQNGFTFPVPAYHGCLGKEAVKWLSLSVCHDEQELSSSWDGRPFGHNRRGPKRRGLQCPFWGRGLHPHLTLWSGPRSTSILSGILIHTAVWPQYMGPKVGRLLWPFFLRGRAGCPSNTMLHCPRPTSLPSDILIHPTVGPEYTSVTDRTDRQTGQRPDSVGRTVFGRPFIQELSSSWDGRPWPQ